MKKWFTEWVEWLVIRFCRALSIARVHELERLEEKIELGWDEVAAKGCGCDGCEKELAILQEEVQESNGRIADLEKAMEDVNELADNVDLDDLTHAFKLMENDIEMLTKLVDKVDLQLKDTSFYMEHQLHATGQWIEETNEILVAVRELLTSHEVVFDAESLTWRQSQKSLTPEMLEKVEKLLEFHAEVEQGGWMAVMMAWRDRLKAVEAFQAELSRVFRLPDSK